MFYYYLAYHVYFRSGIRPGAELELAGLHVEGEILHVHRTVTRVDSGGHVHNATVMVQRDALSGGPLDHFVTDTGKGKDADGRAANVPSQEKLLVHDMAV